VVETANDLLVRCTAAARGGADFEAVWDSILRGHPLVVSAPVETFTDDERPQLEVRLINGQRLIYPGEQPVLRFVGAAAPSVLATIVITAIGKP